MGDAQTEGQFGRYERPVLQPAGNVNDTDQPTGENQGDSAEQSAATTGEDTEGDALEQTLGDDGDDGPKTDEDEDGDDTGEGTGGDGSENTEGAEDAGGPGDDQQTAGDSSEGTEGDDTDQPATEGDEPPADRKPVE